MYLHKTPKFIQNLFPQIIWKIPTKDKKVYLSFDDGPQSGITDWVLEILMKFNAKASFFCVGTQIENNLEIIHKIRTLGHAIGQHGYNHISGWYTGNTEYFADVEKANQLIGSKFFRPPYGRITRSQYLSLKEKYTIVMWDVLSGDFDQKLSKEKCLNKSKANTEPGSIIVFHDNPKSYRTIRYVLPRYLEHFSLLGYTFDTIESINTT